MSILENAVDSIAIGLEDYRSSDKRRTASCARNLFAGILLLFKHKLNELSPPNSNNSLIKQNVYPVYNINDEIIWQGKGTKTVGIQGIKERFVSLNIEVDWKKVDEINKFRNDIEHYYSTEKHNSIKHLISNTFIIINDFIRNYLNDEPKNILGLDSWIILLEENEVYEKELLECNEALHRLEYYCDEILDALESFSCEDCGSPLIKPTKKAGKALDSDFVCSNCDHTLSYEDIAPIAVINYYEYEDYLATTEGGHSPLAGCPSCGEVYIFEKNVCCSCGYKAIQTCLKCSNSIIPEELSTEPYCSWCSHMIEKTMND